MRTHLILGVALHLAGTSLALAQTATGVIRGRVQDTTGAVIIDVQVTLVDERRNQSWDQTTNSEGFFEFRALPFGDYRLELERPGFKKEVIDGCRSGSGADRDAQRHVAGRIASRVDSRPGRSWLARSLGREFVSGHRRHASSGTADERAQFHAARFAVGWCDQRGACQRHATPGELRRRRSRSAANETTRPWC